MDGLVSLIFFIIEFIILIAVIRKARYHPHWKTISAMLIFLQLYQLTEFLICTGVNANIVGRLAFASITMLPPLGYYFSTQMVQWKNRDYMVPGAMGLGFIIYYAILPVSVQLVDCNPFYATYQYPNADLYGYYYFGIILYSIGFLLYHIMNSNSVPQIQLQLLIGYMAFLLPMAMTIFVNQSAREAIPSIMCKYAITLALVLGYMAFRTGDFDQSENVVVKVTDARLTG